MNNLILLLSRNQDEYGVLLSKYLSHYYNIVCIYDDTTYTDNDCLNNSFVGLTKTIKTPSSWDKAFLYIKNHNLVEKFDNFYFIEDDVFSSCLDSFHELITKLDNLSDDLITHKLYSINDIKAWQFWPPIQNDIKYFDQTKLARSLNPFCKLSSKLVQLILEFQNKNQTLVFHEILFPSVAHSNNLSVKYLSLIDNIKDYFGTFTYKKVFGNTQPTDNKIHHPVKIRKIEGVS